MAINNVLSTTCTVILTLGLSASANGAVATNGDIVLFNLLGSRTQIQNSVIGVDGVFTEPVGFNPVQNGNGVALKKDLTGVGQVVFDRPFDTVFPDAGTIEFWWIPQTPENTGSGSHFDERSPLWLTSDALSLGSGWPEILTGLRYGCCGDLTRLDFGLNLGPSVNLDYDLNFDVGQKMHMGITWDKSLGMEPIKLFVNGALQTPTVKFSRDPDQVIDVMQSLIADPDYTYDIELLRRSKRPDGADEQIDPEAYVDSLMIFDYAKTDFSDTIETVIPIPAAIWLFGSGLIGLIGIARTKKS